MANQKPKPPNRLLPWLDVLAITAWGILLLYYTFSAKIYILIHEHYIPLVVISAIAILAVGFLKGRQILRRRRGDNLATVQHLMIFPPGWGGALLLTTAILGFIISPQPFSSQKALGSGVNEIFVSSRVTRVKPQEFRRASVSPEKRSLVDWVRTLNVYPEPDSYTGQKVNVQGFTIYPTELGQEYFLLARFVVTCCAADAYPIGLPVKLKENFEKFPPDTWLQVEGQMVTETIAGKRQLTIAADSLKKISQPKNPYSY
jgi:uncharacterized repeat protein (TIGR03943 family)